MFAMSDGRAAPARPDAVVQGDTYRFTVLTSRLIRMEWSATGTFTDRPTQLVVDRDFPVPAFTATATKPPGDDDAAAAQVEIVTDHLHLRYDGGPFSPATLAVTLIKGAADPHYATWRYGQPYPEDLPHRGNLRSTARTLDEVDGATELEPGILATFGFAAIDDSRSILLSADGWITQRPDPEARDLYFFGHGRDYAGALADYHHLTGPIPLIPRQILGNWWSRYWPYTDASYLALMDRFAAEEIPLSVAVIDMDWHLVDIDPELGTGWTGYTWNRDLFPDPPAFLAQLHERGLGVTLNTHPADGVRRHEERYPQMAAAMGIDPATGHAVEFDITSRTFVDAYLRILHHPLEADGVDFWWLDWQSGGQTRIPGLDPLWMLNHLHFTDSGRERAGEVGGAVVGSSDPNGHTRERRRPLTFSRYASLGSHRYPIGFSGDTIISWASLDFQPEFTATAANVGFTWWSHDVGGHMFGGRDVELAVRWSQLGVFSPVNRMHSSNSPFTGKEPWGYGPEAAATMGRFLRLRHRLVPTLYTAAWAAHAENVSVVRPMYHDHPQVPEAYGVPNQAMVGEHLLVAPITTPSDSAAHLAPVRVWLPQGSWVDLLTGHRYDGGRTVLMHRTREQLPVLARTGAVIALASDPFADVSERPDSLTLRVVPGNGRSRLVEDDGAAAPSVADANVLEMVQEMEGPDGDGRVDLVLRLSAMGGVDPVRDRGLVLEVAGVSAVESVLVTVAGGPAGASAGSSAGGSAASAEAGGSAASAEAGGSAASAEAGESEKASLSAEASWPAEASGAVVIGVVEDEVLAPALRIGLGRVDLTRGLEIRIVGARARPVDVVGETFALLDLAEIPTWQKERAWAALTRLSGLDAVQELATVPLPDALRDAVIEVSAAKQVW